MLELLDAHYMSQYEAQCLQAPHPQCLIPPSITNLSWSNERGSFWTPSHAYVARFARRHHTHNATSLHDTFGHCWNFHACCTSSAIISCTLMQFDFVLCFWLKLLLLRVLSALLVFLQSPNACWEAQGRGGEWWGKRQRMQSASRYWGSAQLPVLWQVLWPQTPMEASANQNLSQWMGWLRPCLPMVSKLCFLAECFLMPWTFDTMVFLGWRCRMLS